MIDLHKIFTDITNNKKEKIMKEWGNSKFLDFKNLSIDEKSQCGVEFIKIVLKQIFPQKNIEISKGNRALITIDNKKILIKIASKDRNNKFQNENIELAKETNGLIRLAITNDKIFYNISDKSSLNLLNAHHRWNASDKKQLKQDFKIKDYKELKNIEEFKEEILNIIK